MAGSTKGAGGTPGGVGSFFAGLAMMVVGFYLLLNKIVVVSSFGMGHSLYRGGVFGGLPFQVNITTGMVFVPMIVGIVMIFYSAKSVFGWLLFVLSLVAMIAGVITSLQIRMHSMSAFDIIIIFTLAFGGLGLFLRSLASSGNSTAK